MSPMIHDHDGPTVRFPTSSRVYPVTGDKRRLSVAYGCTRDHGTIK